MSRDQARIVFDDARQMCLLSRPLRKRVNIQAHKGDTPENQQPVKATGSKSGNHWGTNPSLAIVDEYHLHPDNGVYSALELGMGARPEGCYLPSPHRGATLFQPVNNTTTIAARYWMVKR